MPSVGAKRREQENARRIAAATAENEIAPIPPIFDVERRIRCERDPVLWLKTYLPLVFKAEFSASQERFIRICWETILADGSKNIEAYRGFGKTSILSGLMLMGLATGRFRHAYYVTAEGERTTKQASEWFATALYEDYDKKPQDAKPFAQDYPEICYPLQRRRGVANKPLTYKGARCEIIVSPERIQFPIIKGSPSSGSLIIFASIGSAIRGAGHAIRDEGHFRVGAVMFDDVQTDASARSQAEVDRIFSTIVSSVGYLSGIEEDGGKEPLVVLSAITQNRPGDVAQRIREELVDFNTTRIPFLTSVPQNFDAWRAYKTRREEIYRKYPDDVATSRRLINEYYRANAEAIERDCVADNPLRKERAQLTAIQYALEKWASSERSFWSELQNDAERGAQEDDGGLTPIVVERKTRVADPNAEYPRALRPCEIPDGADVLTAFVDAGEHYLNYQVTAFSKDFSLVHVVDFGIWPEQPVEKTTKKSFSVDLQDEYVDGDKFDRLADATLDLLTAIFERQYFDAQGRPVDVDEATEFEQHARPRGASRRRFCKLALCGVDCGDGEMELALWSAIDAFHRRGDGRFFGRAIPCYGDAASARLMRYYALKPGEWRRAPSRREATEFDWIENPRSRDSVARRYANVYASLLFDSNTAKTRRESAWFVPVGRPGSATVCAAAPEAVATFAAHQCAEEKRPTRKGGNDYNLWSMKKPRVSDNEFLDTDGGCRVLAEYVGCDAVAPSESTKRRANRPSVGRADFAETVRRRLLGGNER